MNTLKCTESQFVNKSEFHNSYTAACVHRPKTQFKFFYKICPTSGTSKCCAVPQVSILQVQMWKLTVITTASCTVLPQTYENYFISFFAYSTITCKKLRGLRANMDPFLMYLLNYSFFVKILWNLDIIQSSLIWYISENCCPAAIEQPFMPRHAVVAELQPKYSQQEGKNTQIGHT
jgi:hypothetical protein